MYFSSGFYFFKKANINWAVVSMKWYKKWELYVKDFNEKTPASPTTADTTVKSEEKPNSQYPGPCYNDDIILFEQILHDPLKPKYSQYSIKPGLQENIDFMLVPEKVWERWSHFYGGLTLQRFSLEMTPEQITPVIEVFLQKINLMFVRSFATDLPEDTQTLYISRKAKASELIEKCRRSGIEIAGHDKLYQMKIILWKLRDPDMEIFNALGRKSRESIKNPIPIDAEMIEPTKIIEDLAIGNSTVILVEVSPENMASMFQESKVVKPRIEEFEDVDWQKFVTIEDSKFAKIPLKCIVNTGYNCGRTGLENLGNTCYMNSGLQCLSSCQELTKYFLLGLYRDEINKENPLGQKGYLAQAYAELILDMWKGNSRVMTAYALKKRIAIKSEQFTGYAQHDSQELILYVLDGLHEDLNRVKKKPYIPSKDYVPGTPDKELSLELWTDYLQRNRSVVVDLFAGQLKSRVVCPTCSRESVTFDPFMILSVPIPQLSVLSITFIHFDILKGATELKLIITEGTIIADLWHKITEKVQIGTKNQEMKLCYAIVSKGKIIQRLAGDMNCLEAKKLGEIYAFEYENIAKDNYLMEIQMQYMSNGMFGKTRNDFAYPLVLNVSRNITINNLKKLILSKLLPFVKEVPIPKNEDRVKYMYEHYFGKAKNNTPPFTFELVNNRPKSSKYLVSTSYSNCEYCLKGGHSENCEFKFTNEDKGTIGDLLKMLQNPRELVLNLLFPDSSNNSMLSSTDIETLKKNFNKLSVIDLRPPKTSKISLYDCLECFSKEEQLDDKNMWYCPKCKKSVQATKKMDIYKLPDICIIHLKRFKHKASSMWSSNKKIEDFVDYPIAGLDLKRYIKAPPEIAGNTVYDLFAVSNHFGGLSGGHYTATCYNAALGKWMYFNDTSVGNAGEEDIISSAGYVLFYRRVNNNNEITGKP